MQFRMPSPGTASYDDLATEYYDSVRHPTCSDLRRASRVLLDNRLGQLACLTGPSIEIGAGMSLIAEAFTERHIPLNNLTLNDESEAMLRHSAIWIEQGARPLVGRVEDIGQAERKFDLVFACLGDPYNTPQAWKSIGDMLNRGGSFFFTIPSFEWANYFRRHHQSGLERVAEFEVASGERIYVPSIVHTVDQQKSLIEMSGLRLTNVDEVNVGQIPGGARSPKLMTTFGDEMTVVTAFIGTK
jgi:hypothetical protein